MKGSETDPNLPAKAVDLVLMVDVYHELAYPFEVMTKIREALKPGGRVVFVEYRKEALPSFIGIYMYSLIVVLVYSMRIDCGLGFQALKRHMQLWLARNVNASPNGNR